MNHRPNLTRAESMPTHLRAPPNKTLSRGDSMHSPATSPPSQRDSILHEATLKACEIIVRSRCLLPDDTGRPRPNSRFNLRSNEVPPLRTSIPLAHALRLDIYHEHRSQRELLERWCFRHRPHSSDASLPLRAVCQRIVVALRCLHCWTRMLPAHSWTGRRRGEGVGYSVYAAPRGGEEEALPSPSFVREDLPAVATGEGVWSVAVMYDATMGWEDRCGGERGVTRPIPIVHPGRELSSERRPVSDYIISDYHSPSLSSVAAEAPRNGDDNDADIHRDHGSAATKAEENPRETTQPRVMSGLSLAMMGEDQEHGNAIPPRKHSRNAENEEPLTSWGSPATRAAFHLPPGYADGGAGEGGNGMRHVGYGWEGQEPPPPPPSLREGSSGDGLSISPSPLISTPPQAMWARSQKAAGDGEEVALSRIPPAEEGASEDLAEGDDAIAPPFTNPTSLQPLPSSSALRIASPSSVYGISPHHHAGLEKSSDHARKRTSSSSVLLPPVTSLDLLQKSPFSGKKRMATGTESPGGTERADSDGLVMPFVLESYRDEMLTSSIPRMISADVRQRTNSIGRYSLGAGSSADPILPPFGNLASISGGYYSTGPLSSTRSSGGQHSHHIDADEMPFAVDDDFPSVGGASNPFSGRGSKSLLGSTKGDTLDETSTMNGLSEVTSSLAVSSLHQRCAPEGKPRLKLFESTQTMKWTSRNSNAQDGPSNNDYATIKDQLSDFCSFGASLMVGSIHDSRSE